MMLIKITLQPKMSHPTQKNHRFVTLLIPQMLEVCGPRCPRDNCDFFQNNSRKRIYLYREIMVKKNHGCHIWPMDGSNKGFAP